MQEEQLYAECKQDERTYTSSYQSYYVFALLFSKKNLIKARYRKISKISPSMYKPLQI